MSIIDISVALQHLRLEPDYPAEQVQPYLDAAERAAQNFLNRSVYVDGNALAAAVAGVPAALLAAAADRDARLTLADGVADPVAQAMVRQSASDTYAQAVRAVEAVLRGVVVDAVIQAAMLLQLGFLYETRVDDGKAELLPAVKNLLLPYRMGWGG